MNQERTNQEQANQDQANPDAGIQSVTLTPQHLPQIYALLGDAGHKPLLWDWQFNQSPFDKPFHPVVLEHAGRLVGFNGVMPVLLCYQGHLQDATWSCDFYVDAAWRGKGLGRKLKEVLIADSPPLVMSFGISNHAAPVLLHLGWQSSPEVFNFRSIRTTLRSLSLRTLLLSSLQWFNRQRGRWFAAGEAEQPLQLALSATLPAIDELDQCWVQVAPGYQKVVVRNGRYLQWKYQQHPLARYTFVIARDSADQLAGLLVVRRYQDTLRLIDYLGPAQDYGLKRQLLQKVCLAYPDITQCILTTSDAEWGQVAQDAGFFRARSQPRFYVRSDIPGDVNCERGWFLMAGDSDGELLLAAREALQAEVAQ